MNQELDKYYQQVLAATKKLAVENLGVHFVVIAVNRQGQLCVMSTDGLPDPLTRIMLLSEATKAEAETARLVQQQFHQAVQAETVRLVQESTKAMTKQ
jgi:hypothetical protein